MPELEPDSTEQLPAAEANRSASLPSAKKRPVFPPLLTKFDLDISG
jgi:hypothetical protein